MAYNSDGYIMIDFTEVDFRRTNQTIDGLYKRCVDVIGTNKFILVINANGRTPLPATCSFTNNQYVIDTCIYMFAISSNDNLFIRRNDVPASDIIDDSSISVDKTWSSNKIDTELDGKQDTLTPVSPISINADNEISVDLSGKQDALTAGENITILNDVISSNPVKSLTYTGTGTSTAVITFPVKPKFIFISAKGTAISGSTALRYNQIALFNYGSPFSISTEWRDDSTYTTSVYVRPITITYNDNVISIRGGSSNMAMNFPDTEYTVYYI